jgi:1-acyl-sn-glycerol-3-phosphate acyltransferase
VNEVAQVDEAGFEVLSPSECMRLLERGGLGQVTLPADDAGVPGVRTVNFALDGDRVVIRTGNSRLWQAALERQGATFGVNEGRNLDHTGWSVVVTGRLDPLPPDERARALPLRSWAPARRDRFVALAVEEASGRRSATPGAAGPPRPAAVDAGGVDDWGRSTSTRRLVGALLDPAYRHWFRVEWEGLEHVPPHGGALLVANHAGAVPVDAPLIMHGLEREKGRAVYALHHHGLRAMPFLGRFLARNGGVVAHPDNAARLLREEGQLLLVFPEGAKGTTKPYSQRYQLARFGRGGFVDTAMRAGVPVVPIAVVGTEETMPTVVRVPAQGEVGWPVTLNSVLFGPLGAFVHLPAKVRVRVLEPVVFDQPPGLDHYPTSTVADAAEDVRTRLQDALVDMVAARRSIWWG